MTISVILSKKDNLLFLVLIITVVTLMYRMCQSYIYM
jgi:hypothetical protein